MKVLGMINLTKRKERTDMVIPCRYLKSCQVEMIVRLANYPKGQIKISDLKIESDLAQQKKEF